MDMLEHEKQIIKDRAYVVGNFARRWFYGDNE